MTSSIIAIKGNYFDKTDFIFEPFNYTDNKSDHSFETFDKALSYLFNNYFEFANKEIALRAIWQDNGWTLIYDPEMIDLINNQALESISKKFETVIYTFLIQTNSNSFSFSKYSLNSQRQFFFANEQIEINIGASLPEESGLNINEKISSIDLIKLANKLGIQIENSSPNTNFIVKELSYK